MKHNLVLLFVVLICTYTSSWAQKQKTTPVKKAPVQALTRAQKMGYVRTNKYWGPGTYYCFAPGAPVNKTIVNTETAFRDFTCLSREDFFAEIANQGYTDVPPKEVQKWFNVTNSKEMKFYYSPDKSFILSANIADMWKSDMNGVRPFGVLSVQRYVLIPKQDSLKVLDLTWEYMRELYEMKVVTTYGSTFKKAKDKVYPIEQAGSTGWASIRAGTFVLRMVDGKPKGNWMRNEDIVRRTMGNPEFKITILGLETDFVYGLTVKLLKEGYVLRYETVCAPMGTLEGGDNWIAHHKLDVASYTGSLKMDADAVGIYKKAPLPPVLEDIKKVLHY